MDIDRILRIQRANLQRYGTTRPVQDTPSWRAQALTTKRMTNVIQTEPINDNPDTVTQDDVNNVVESYVNVVHIT